MTPPRLPRHDTTHTIRRIAHRAGNGRPSLRAAIAAHVDWIEIDLWYQYGRLVARHERGVWRLPLVYDRWKLHPHFRPLYLEEIIRLTAAGPGLLLDFKGTHPPLASTVARAIQAGGAAGRTAVCGQFWRPLDEIGDLEPRVQRFYSLGRPEHVGEFLRRLDCGLTAAGVSIGHWLLTEPIATRIRERGLEVFVWTVNDPQLASALVDRGATGIISDKLDLLAELP